LIAFPNHPPNNNKLGKMTDATLYNCIFKKNWGEAEAFLKAATLGQLFYIESVRSREKIVRGK